jgi:hypothetical protein
MNHALFSQLSSPPPGAIENWLLSAAAVVSMVLLGRKLFARKTPAEPDFVSQSEFLLFRQSVERDLGALRDRLDDRFERLGEKVEQTKSDLLAAGEQRGRSIHERINQLEAGLARVDERTHGAAKSSVG